MSLVIEGKYELSEKLGEGSFGKIFKGKNKNTGSPIAVKIEKDKGGLLLKNEARIYQQLAGLVGIPRMRSFGTEGKFSYLVMDLLGKTLEDVKKAQGGMVPLRIVIAIGLQMLKRLEELHKRGIVHRDVKPENFLFGLNESMSLLHVVDFGLARYYKDPSGKHIAMATGRKLTGTARYASLNIHRGLTPSRRDDLESTGYIMLYLLIGSLPWQGILSSEKESRERKVCEVKSSNQLWEIFSDVPGEFITYLQYCRKLEFDSDPNYVYLTNLLKNLHRLTEPSVE